MSHVVESIHGEFQRYKALAEGAFRQLTDAQLSEHGPDVSNSVATICWHVAGNLQSRFTEFLTSDGEKPWRHREEEFEARAVTHAVLEAKWALGWRALDEACAALDDSALDRTVTIRGQVMTVTQALLRALAHISYHVGQIVYVAKAMRGGTWQYLSIPPGQSDAYNKAATMELPSRHAAAIDAEKKT